MKKSSINKIKNSKKVTHCYIRKGGAYYRPEAEGYTDFLSRAGVFTKDKAVSEAENCKEIYIVPINVSDHNKMIVQTVSEILTRYINPTK